jgi:Zn-dependent protease
MNETLFQAAAVILPVIFAIVFHEVAHGWMARALGDPTAHEMKRLSLNPLRHVDMIGTVILPAFLKLVGAPVFGWAKPVPVNYRRLRNPRLGMMAVAAAGPGSNLILALLAAVAMGLLTRAFIDGSQPSGFWVFVGYNLQNFLLINIFLAFFNLLPIPPFDGSHIVEGLLPRQAARRYAQLRPYGFPLLFVLLLVLPWAFPSLRIVERLVVPPVEWMHEWFVGIVRAIALA